MNSVVKCVTVFLLLSNVYFTTATTVNRVAVIGSDVVFPCESSFAPPWAKVGPKLGQYKTLMVNGKKHPNLKDPRITFSNQGDVYQLDIRDLAAKDAGTYVCDGDNPVSYLLNVVR